MASRSYRDQIRGAKAGNDYYANLTGKPRLDYSGYKLDAKPRVRHAPDPDAPPLERDVLKAVWKFLAHHRKVAWITRIQSGAAIMYFGADGMHPLYFNRKRGISDLLGQMKDGRILCCEVKREGAQLMDHQREFLNEVRANGGVAFVARCVRDAEEALQ